MKTLKEHFIDWEGHVFGYGYGSGEGHIIPVLKAFLELCCDGDSKRGYDYEELEQELSPTVAWLLINQLCAAQILEYGTSPRCGWLTDEGEALRDFVQLHSSDDLLEMIFSRTEHDNPCYPDCCTCDEGPCNNPFWRSKT